MSKLIIVLLGIIIISGIVVLAGIGITTSTANNNDTNENRFLFDPTKHMIQNMHANRIFPETLAEIESHIRYPHGLIAIVEVAGPSVNRLLSEHRDPNIATGVNHVVTPMIV